MRVGHETIQQLPKVQIRNPWDHQFAALLVCLICIDMISTQYHWLLCSMPHHAHALWPDSVESESICTSSIRPVAHVSYHVRAWQEARIGGLLRAVHHCLLDMSYLRGSQRWGPLRASGSLWDSSCLEGNDVQPWAVSQSLPPAKPLHVRPSCKQLNTTQLQAVEGYFQSWTASHHCNP